MQHCAKKARTLLTQSLFFIALLLIANLAAAFVPPTGWETQVAKARVIARKENKPILVYFYNNDVRPCREIERDALLNPELAPRMENFVRVAVDEARNQQLVRASKLVKVPTILFLNPSGLEIDRAVGYKTGEELRQYLDRIEKSATTAASSATEMERFDKAALDIMTPGPGSIAVPLRFRAPTARSVYLVGDFNDWRTDATPMVRSPAGDWDLLVHLREGVYEYLFLIDGKYERDPYNALQKANPYGGTNSVIIVGQPKFSPMINGRTALFILYKPEATSIEVAGSFNNWKPLIMFRNPEDPAMWGVQYTLPPGEYTYKYVIDGEWTMDPENYLPKPDSHGTLNNSFIIK